MTVRNRWTYDLVGQMQAVAREALMSDNQELAYSQLIPYRRNKLFLKYGLENHFRGRLVPCNEITVPKTTS